MPVDTTRHFSVFQPIGWKDPIHIIGVGATGSRIAISIAKLGIPGKLIYVYDPDIVESHNLANQAFDISHIGKKKVDALKEIILRATGEEINAIDRRINKDSGIEVLDSYCFLLTDTMGSRKEILNCWLRNNSFMKWVIETRMGVELIEINTFNPNNEEHVKAFESRLFEDSDDSIERSPCGTPISVGMTAEIVSGLAVWQFIRCVNLELNKEEADEAMKNSIKMCIRPYIFFPSKIQEAPKQKEITC